MEEDDEDIYAPEEPTIDLRRDEAQAQGQPAKDETTKHNHVDAEEEDVDIDEDESDSVRPLPATQLKHFNSDLFYTGY